RYSWRPWLYWSDRPVPYCLLSSEKVRSEPSDAFTLPLIPSLRHRDVPFLRECTSDCAARARAQDSLTMVVSGVMESPGRRDEECQADQQHREQEAGGDVDGPRAVGPHLVPRWGHRPEPGETSRHSGQDDGAETEIDERAGRRGDGRQEASEQHPITAGGVRVPALPIDPPLGDRPSPPPCVARVRSLHLSGRNDGSRSGTS